MDREARKQLAAETLAILERGGYEAGAGFVSLGDQHALGRAAAILYRPDHAFEAPKQSVEATQLTVANETTLAAGARLVRDDPRAVALNFASAKNPGGGFLGGSQAQEESLARSSALYVHLKDSPFYAFHRQQGDAFYSHHILYTPDVPVFRDDDGTLLDTPWPCSFITSPAVNVGALIQNGSTRLDEVRAVMTARIARILDVAALHRHDTVILGAFGCGVFQNDPVMVADIFATALATTHARTFARVHFAVLDRPDGACIRAFRARFEERSDA